MGHGAYMTAARRARVSSGKILYFIGFSDTEIRAHFTREGYSTAGILFADVDRDIEVPEPTR